GALREAELWTVAARDLTGATVPVDALDGMWKTVLLHQFHDIIPGTSIHWVYADTHADHQRVLGQAEQIVAEALGSVASAVDVGAASRPVLVANSLPFDRHELVEVDDGSLVAVAAPACGWAVVDLDAPPGIDSPPVTVGANWFANGILRVEWDESGLLTSVRHLGADREALAEGTRANVLQMLDDTPEHWDAWDIDRAAFDTAVDLADVDEIEVVAADDARATLRVVRTFGSSRIEQRLQLTRGSGRLEIASVVDWHEDHKLLKVAFPVAVDADVATHEIQFGHVERPTRPRSSWDEARFETCAHTWVDLSDDGFGVALLNDCKYGHDVQGNVLRLSLLRAPTWPDPVADRGRHTFTYALYPHVGGPTDGGVIAEAHALNTPLRVVPAGGSSASVPSEHSVVHLDDPGVVVSAVKPADDGDDLVVRCHEAFGHARRVRLRVPGAESAWPVDLLEQPTGISPLVAEEGTFVLELGPFELVTLRLVSDETRSG
ncbi:MAG: alpha-mannosidase, partial [Acidimicrobiales bacterium]